MQSAFVAFVVLNRDPDVTHCVLVFPRLLPKKFFALRFLIERIRWLRAASLLATRS